MPTAQKEEQKPYTVTEKRQVHPLQSCLSPKHLVELNLDAVLALLDNPLQKSEKLTEIELNKLLWNIYYQIETAKSLYLYLVDHPNEMKDF